MGTQCICYLYANVHSGLPRSGKLLLHNHKSGVWQEVGKEEGGGGSRLNITQTHIQEENGQKRAEGGGEEEVKIFWRRLYCLP